MRLAVLGSGMIVRDFLSFAHELPGVEVVSLFGRPAAQERLEQLRAEHGIARVYTDLDACLADPDVDTVYVALPNHVHHRFARAALLAGKHVICEKPFTLTLTEFDDLVELARERGLVLVEAITTVHLPNFLAAKAALPQLGRLRLVHSSYSQYSSRYPAFQRGEVLPAFDPTLGGGALMDLGIYTVHFVVGLLGAPTSVRYTPNLDRGVDTSGVLVLGYDDVQAACMFAKDSAGPQGSVAQGIAGTLEMDGSPSVCSGYRLDVRGQVPEEVDVSTHPHRMVPEFRAFEQMIREHDLAARDHQLAHSRLVLETLTEARRDAGLRLGPADS